MSYEQLPDALPAPVDDGAADHLAGTPLGSLSLPSTRGGEVDLAASARAVVYVYPMTGRPGVALPEGWDDIPGARGCTPESTGFRDRYDELTQLGVQVLGLSSQNTAYQLELAERLGLPYPLLSDEGLRLAEHPGLPTFEVEGRRLYRRLTLVLRAGRIEHAFYPVFPPHSHAAEVVDWLRAHPGQDGAS